MTRYLASLIFAALLLNGCSDPQSPQQPEKPAAEPPATSVEAPAPEPADAPDQVIQPGQVFIYRCDDGTDFELTIIGSSAHMELDSTSYELRQQPAASGIFHAGDLWQVHSKAETALLIGPDSTRECDRVAMRQLEPAPAIPAAAADSAAAEAEHGVE